MAAHNPDILILGAGIAGLATAYQLSVKHGIKNITIVDEREPLGLTSSRGTMAYRNWFPEPDMVQLLNRSIDLMEEIDDVSNHASKLSRRGYVYLTANPAQIEPWRTLARAAAQRGVGEFRDHTHTGAPPYQPSPSNGWRGVQSGTDLVTDPGTIRQLLPQITPDVVAMLHVRRCGSLDVPALGDWLLQQIQANGGEYVRDRVTGINVTSNQISSVALASGTEISTRTLVIAAGPLLPHIARMLQLELPVYSELHGKVTFRDTAHVFPRFGDLVYWNDPQSLPWTESERREFSASPETAWLVDPFPGGVHFLPKGTSDDPVVMGLWTFSTHVANFSPDMHFDPHNAEIILRGLARVVPGARAYFGQGHSFTVDGGYYCKTRENLPLIGPLPIDGAYLCGALSGYGVMSAQGAADLVSAHITGKPLPPYAARFLLSRYDDPAYEFWLNTADPRAGQL